MAARDSQARSQTFGRGVLRGEAKNIIMIVTKLGPVDTSLAVIV